MEKVMNYFTGFFGGLVTILMAILPVAILWQVLTGTMCFGMDVIANLTAMINTFGTNGFVGLVALVIVMSFFVKK
jgi:hypothetical protein